MQDFARPAKKDEQQSSNGDGDRMNPIPLASIISSNVLVRTKKAAAAAAGTGNRKFNDVIVGYVDEYEELLAKKNLTFNEEI